MVWLVAWSCARPPEAPALPPAAPPVPAVPAPPVPEPETPRPPTHRTSEVPCGSVEDCWFSDEDPAQPIARPPKQKGREFVPCSDGDFDLQCLDGHCALRLGLAC